MTYRITIYSFATFLALCSPPPLAHGQDQPALESVHANRYNLRRGLGGPESILIRPWNFDAAAPWDYTLRSGVANPGRPVSSGTWNRPAEAFAADRSAGGMSSALDRPAARVNSADVTSPPARSIAAPDRPADRSVAPRVTALREVAVLGYSISGNPIIGYRFGPAGSDGSGGTVIFGGIHGSEPNSAGLARRLAEHLRQRTDWNPQQRVMVIPVANPDGLARKSRTNARGVDLNRNFAAKNWRLGKAGDAMFGGPEALSEPETRLLAELISGWQPSQIVSIHAITGNRECVNYDGPADQLAEQIGRRNGYKVVKSLGYATPGSFGSWAGGDLQLPTITLELPVTLDEGRCWEQHRAALLELVGCEDKPAQTETGK